MKLAKPHLDVAVMTDRIEPMLAFWRDEIGLALEEELPTGGGNLQYRLGLHGSVFKLNHSRQLPDAPRTGIRELWIAREGERAPRLLHDPDGNAVRLVPPGEGGVEGIGVRIAGRDLAALAHFYGQVLELPGAKDTGFRCGDSLVTLEADPDAPQDVGIAGRGYRYLTIQIFDCEAEHARILAAGAREGMPPRRAGDVAIFSMVNDPSGNWVEISQRGSLTGGLPPRE